MIFVLFYSLICPLYHHANNSISMIGYLFMRGITYSVINRCLSSIIFITLLFDIICDPSIYQQFVRWVAADLLHVHSYRTFMNEHVCYQVITWSVCKHVNEHVWLCVYQVITSTHQFVWDWLIDDTRLAESL